MAEITRLSGGSDCIELAFVEREATPEPLMKLGIRLHLAGLSLSNTVSELDRFGVDRARSTVHNWVQKAGLQPEEGRCPDHVALDETVIQIDDQQYWLYAAIDPETNEFLHVKLGIAQNLGLSELFLGELQAKHDVSSD
jgi:putative transposase